MQIFAEFESHEALVREFESNLGKARAFVAGQYEVGEREEVELVLIHPVSGEWLPLRSEVVYIAAAQNPAVGLEILEWSPERAALIESFVKTPQVAPLSLVSPESVGQERLELSRATPHVTVAPASFPPASEGEEPFDERDPDEGSPSESEDEVVDEPEEEGAPRGPGSSRSSSEIPSSRRSVPPPKNVQERVRRLNVREREAIARGGTLTERVALERAYGAAVWDGLLSNAALTGPEVARIAKNGNATIPHLTLIVGNSAWLAKGEVRRALLTNPRLSPLQIERVLRALPPAELKQLPKQTAYAPKVRAVALRMLTR